jgi:general secretion pathway protein J
MGKCAIRPFTAHWRRSDLNSMCLACFRRGNVDPAWHRRVMAKQRGFTLLELLVALAVLGLLMAGLVQGLRLGVSVWITQTKRLAASGDLDSTDRTLRTLIARMDPGGLSGRPPTFKGTARSLVFTTTLPDAAAGLAVRNSDVTLAVDEAHQLELLFLPHYRNPTEAAPAPGRVVLLHDVERLEMAYWQDSEKGWQSEWRGVTLPKLIRIRIVFRDSVRHSPDIVVTPMRDRWQL